MKALAVTASILLSALALGIGWLACLSRARMRASRSPILELQPAVRPAAPRAPAAPAARRGSERRAASGEQFAPPPGFIISVPPSGGSPWPPGRAAGGSHARDAAGDAAGAGAARSPQAAQPQPKARSPEAKRGLSRTPGADATGGAAVGPSTASRCERRDGLDPAPARAHRRARRTVAIRPVAQGGGGRKASARGLCAALALCRQGRGRRPGARCRARRTAWDSPTAPPARRSRICRRRSAWPMAPMAAIFRTG